MSNANTTFADLNLDPLLLKALKDVGYETPSPIQAQTIPLLIKGKDVLGQAQTGTGKTAAFALPLLSRLNTKEKGVQILVLTPTRELAIQVSEAFQKYAKHLKKFHVLPVYGGASITKQIYQLQRGVHVVVGTPGRIMDHIRRKTLKLKKIQALVLDEADEMLRMGFINDVEWILDHTPKERQTALFSATMPKPIRKIAQKYLQNPEEVTVKFKTTTAETINQRCIFVPGTKKLEALTQILESETTDGILIFVRTKYSTSRLADKLSARGYNCDPLNGDISQNKREKTVERFKKGKLDVVVATDVAARGLDVDRISHVINYDIPYDTESYVHRIGRTGRAGRQGEAILFVAPRENHLLKAIEKATKKEITVMKLKPADKSKDAQPIKENNFVKEKLEKLDFSEESSLFEVNPDHRPDPLIKTMRRMAAKGSLKKQRQIVTEYQKLWSLDPMDMAAAFLKMLQKEKEDHPKKISRKSPGHKGKKPYSKPSGKKSFSKSAGKDSFSKFGGKKSSGKKPAGKKFPKKPMRKGSPKKGKPKAAKY